MRDPLSPVVCNLGGAKGAFALPRACRLWTDPIRHLPVCDPRAGTETWARCAKLSDSSQTSVRLA